MGAPHSTSGYKQSFFGFNAVYSRVRQMAQKGRVLQVRRCQAANIHESCCAILGTTSRLHVSSRTPHGPNVHANSISPHVGLCCNAHRGQSERQPVSVVSC